jgi:hypothetical protein
MSVTSKLKRYELILTKVETSKYPTLAAIYDYLNKFDINPSERTLQRDMEELKTEFEIELVYDKKYRGYLHRKKYQDRYHDTVYQKHVPSGKFTGILKNKSGIECCHL